MLVTRFTMFTDSDRPVYFPLEELERSDQAGYSDIPWLHSIDGLGDMHSTVLTNQSVLGTVAIGKSIPSRPLTVHLIFPPGWNPKLFRDQLYDYWSLDLHAGHTYRLEFGDHQYTERYIDGIIESIECDIFSKVPMMHISIVCPNPNYYMIPYAELLLDNVLRDHTFNTTIETGLLVRILPGGSGSFNNIKLECTTSVRGLQSFEFKDSLLAGAPFGPHILGGDVISIDTTPGRVIITLTRGGVEYNLLPFTTITNGVMRVLPTTNVYRMRLLPTNSLLTGRATCKELYLGV